MPNTQRTPISEPAKKKLAIAGVVFFVLLSLALAWYIGRPMVRMVKDPEQFRMWVNAHGIWGRVAYVGMMALQVVVAIIPGEPFEIVAGYAFGALEGTLLCMAGAIIGSVIVFLFVRRVGRRAVEFFFPREKIESLKFLRDTKRLNVIVFFIYLIPGTPKDLLAYVVGLTPMKLSTWLLITCVARLPSVVTSTVGGDALGLQNYTFAIIVFVATALLSVAGMLLYNRLYVKKTKDAVSFDEPDTPR